jgi:TadE-like protein
VPSCRERRGTSSRQAARPGQSLVELALLAPVLFLLVFGAIDVGRAVTIYTALTNAAREAARYSVAHSGDPAVTECAYSSGVLTASPCWPLVADALTIAPQLDTSRFVAFSMSYTHYGTSDGSGGTLAAQVALRYRFQPLVGFVLGGASFTISANATYLQQ